MIVKKVSAIVLAMVILFNILAITTYAIIPTDEQIEHGTQVNQIFQTNNFATYYFYNLHNNFAYNVAESCGYVAFAMLLSFYDVYWNPGFVPDVYLQRVDATLPFGFFTQSPGIVSDFQIASTLDPLFPENSLSVSQYFNYVSTHQNEYFHFYLMNIGISKHYVYPESSSFGIFYDKFQNLMDIYLMFHINDVSLSNSVSLVNCTCDNDLDTKNEIRRLIDQGIPVIIVGYNDDNAHAMIAYDYSVDQNNKVELYVHMGFSDFSNETHIALSTTEFTNDINAYYLDVSSGHVCSEVYVVDGEEVDFCSCSFGVHPSHVHNYEIKTYNSTKHKNECRMCGDYYLTAHVVRVGGVKCIKCGAVVSTDGPVIGMGVVGNSTYILTADNYPYIVDYITDDNSYLLSNGVIVLTHSDMEKYINGELDLSQFEGGNI